MHHACYCTCVEIHVHSTQACTEGRKNATRTPYKTQGQNIHIKLSLRDTQVPSLENWGGGLLWLANSPHTLKCPHVRLGNNFVSGIRCSPFASANWSYCLAVLRKVPRDLRWTLPTSPPEYSVSTANVSRDHRLVWLHLSMNV